MDYASDYIVNFMTGAQLVQECRAESIACPYYIQGAADAAAANEGPLSHLPMICIKPGGSEREIQEVVIAWIDRHKEIEGAAAAALVGLALADTYPCSPLMIRGKRP